MNTLAMLRELQKRVKIELEQYQPARERYFDFVKLLHPEMNFNWFHETLCDKLQQFYEDVMAGNHPRLLICAPPRHGKTQMASRDFPAWCFGRNPKIKIMACSYAAMLASSINRDIQRIIDQPLYNEVFPKTRLNTENVATLSGKPLRNSTIFEIVDHLGYYRSAGVEGGIAGQGYDIGLIDDPIPDAAAALSEVMRESVWEWYRSAFFTRRSPHSGIVLIMTRWHEDDLAGRLLQAQREGADKWEVIRYPAIAEEVERYRNVGDALHPERYSLEMLAATQVSLGSYNWAAMYQQRPAPAGGAIFNRNLWKYWKELPTLEEKVISVDCTFKELKDNDYVAIQVWGRKAADKYLVKRTRERLGFSATVNAIRSIRALHSDATAILIEDKANGPAVIETLSKEIPGVLSITPEGGKVARAFAVQPEQEAGNVYLPDATVDNTVENFLDEVSSFPSAPHDDEVDSMTQALNWFKNRVNKLGMLDFYRREVEELEAKKKQAAA